MSDLSAPEVPEHMLTKAIGATSTKVNIVISSVIKITEMGSGSFLPRLEMSVFVGSMSGECRVFFKNPTSVCFYRSTAYGANVGFVGFYREERGPVNLLHSHSRLR